MSHPHAADTSLLGIESGYFDIDGQYHAALPGVLEKLAALISQPEPQTGDFHHFHVMRPGIPSDLRLHHDFPPDARLLLLDEHQQTPAATALWQQTNLISLPALPAGYYHLHISENNQPVYRCLIIIAPETAYQPEIPADTGKLNGITLQLYSLRSATNWGIGDFTDLARFMRFAGSQKIDFVGINPLHALFTSHPEWNSPYSPSSRFWLNPLYLDVSKITAFTQSPAAQKWLADKKVQATLAALRAAETIDYAAVWAIKKTALQLAFDYFSNLPSEQAEEHRRFDQFVHSQGESLANYALFETLDQHHSSPGQHGWTNWPEAFHAPKNEAVRVFAAQHQQEIRFYMWVQWLCAEQLHAVQQAASEAGVGLGLYGDLAVGSSPDGTDVWQNRRDYCLEASIGAPPDPIGPLGQNWQLPPLHPVALLHSGFHEFIRLLRENMRYCGVLRIDHVMSLNRLWWVVADKSADHGAYVHYPLKAMMAILSLESHRNRCVVIGEDLGTVPDSMRHALQAYQVLSYSVLYFNRNHQGYALPHYYPAQAITVTSTHDVAPLAGFWENCDLHDMHKLGMFADQSAFDAAIQQRQRDKTDLFTALKQAACLPADLPLPVKATPQLIAAVHAFGALSSSKLYAVQLENLLAVKHNFNIPGIAFDYPNWARRLPVEINGSTQQALSRQITFIREIEMKNKQQAMLYPHPDTPEQQTIDSFFFAQHGNPFAYLGRHQVDGLGTVLRTLQPDAESVTVINRADDTPLAVMQKIDSRGFFATRLPDDAPDYALLVQHSGQAPIRVEDPYRYPSALYALDSWLLGEGKHLRPYETLGAHLMELDGVAGVNFCLWAPNARRVSVIGEFNNWDGRVNTMRLHADTGLWEIFLPNVSLNALYKFEILDANGNVRQKSDPYAFGAELRPTTASVVKGLPEKMPEPAWRSQANAIDSPVSIYEVHLGSWRRNLENGFWLTYEELAQELVDYVKDMGFTHIELLPLSEYPFDGSWGYQATGLYAPTSRFGSPQQLQHLIQAAHDAGISVILDWVVGHFPADDHGLNHFDGTPLYEHADPREGYHQDWNTLIYNFGRHEVKNFLQGNALYWIERFGFDGLRVDAVASMIYRDYSRAEGQWIPNQYGGRENLEAIDFLRDTNTMLQQQIPAATEIAEESTSFANVTRAEGLNFQYKWNMGWMNDTLRYMQEDPINRKYHHHLMTFAMMYQYSENFILPLSHDEVVHGKKSLLDRMPGDCWQKFANLRAYYGFMFGFPGKKLLFMGNEFAQGREWNYDQPLDWFLLEEEGGWHKGMQDFVRDLNHTYRAHPALYQLDQWPEGFEWLVVDDVESSVFIFERRDRNGNSLIVISNFTPVVRENYRFGVNRAGVYQEILNSDRHSYQGSGINPGKLTTDNTASHGKAQSLSITVPPLATVYLYLEQ